VLKSQSKSVVAVVDGGIPEAFRFLPDTSTVLDKLKSGQWDLMISVDASDEERSGEAGVYGRAHSQKVINLDHHPTNTLFGDIHLVMPEAVSATEIIFYWLDRVGIHVSQPVATALLTGLVTDTMGFRTSNVNPATMDIARQLMQAGAPLYEIINRTLVARPYSHIELWKQVFPSIQVKDGIISAVVTQENLNQAGLTDMTDGGLVSTLVAAEEPVIAVVFKEQPNNKVELSLRSKPGYDVGTLAFDLGGGGHKQASGATVTGTVEEVRAKVLPLLEVIVRQGKQVASD
jgi:phosphoesterase RecJ-like protein